MTNHYFNGTLSLSDSPSDSPSDFNRMNYIIKDLADQTEKSITDILDQIYNNTNSVNKLVRVLGRIYNNQHTFSGMGDLRICIDKSHVKGYCIGSMQLELQLFELVGNNIELILEDYTDFSFAEDCVHNEDAKSFIS